MTKKSDKAFRTVDVQHELQIKAPPARVWKALTEEIQAWWPAKFYVGSAPLRFTLEPKVGGSGLRGLGRGRRRGRAMVDGHRRARERVAAVER